MRNISMSDMPDPPLTNTLYLFAATFLSNLHLLVVVAVVVEGVVTVEGVVPALVGVPTLTIIVPAAIGGGTAGLGTGGGLPEGITTLN